MRELNSREVSVVSGAGFLGDGLKFVDNLFLGRFSWLGSITPPIIRIEPGSPLDNLLKENKVSSAALK